MITKRVVSLAVVVVLLVIVLPFLGMLLENVDAGEICVIQNPITGTLDWYTVPGPKWQGLGKVTTYHKRQQFWFSAADDQGKKQDESITVRFNDKGHANISGSLAWEMPMDKEHLNQLHTKYGSQEAIEQQLIRTVVEKSVYMTGPLMSSQESAAERRNELLQYIEDQVANGIYRTETIQEKQPDPLTGQLKTVSIVKLIRDSKGLVVRSDESPLKLFGIRTFNPSINQIKYDATVEAQIQEQQKATMAVQTAIANAKKAEQDTITVTENGKAEAAKAKWAQEVEKATEVTSAEKRKAVAALDVQTAELRKRATILEGEGEAEKRRLVMSADGALDPKLRTWLEAQKFWADAFKNYGGQLVPNVVMGSGSGSSGSAGQTATQLVELLTVKTARDLGLDMSMSMPRGRTNFQNQESKK